MSELSKLESRLEKLEIQVRTVMLDNRELQFIVDRMHLKLAEVQCGVEFLALAQSAVSKAFGITEGQLYGDFPDAWLRRTPKGLDSLLFGKDGDLKHVVCQARVVLCCLHRYHFADKRRTHGELELTYGWYSRRQEISLRQLWFKILQNEGKYTAVYRKYLSALALINAKLNVHD